MAADAPLPGEGFGAGVAAALDQAGPLLPLRDAEQLDLLQDKHGRVVSSRIGEATRSRGRPPGASNKRTADVRDYLLSRYAHPLEVLAQMISRPTDTLAAELGCKPVEALALQKSAAAELAPYLEGKMPVTVNVNGRRDVVLFMPGVNAPEVTLGELAQAIEEGGIEAIDWSRASAGQVIEHQPNSGDAPDATEGA